MSYEPVIIILVISAVVGYFAYKHIKEEKFMLETSVKALRVASIFMQYLFYIGIVATLIIGSVVLITQDFFIDFIQSLDVKVLFTSAFYTVDVNVSQLVADNIVNIVLMATPLLVYTFVIYSLIARVSAKILKIFSEGDVFGADVVAKLKQVLIYFIYLFPVRLFDITFKNNHDFNIGLNFNFIAIFVFFYIVFAVYKRAYEVHEESKLTI